MTADTTNALRALADRVLGLTVVGEVCGTERNAIAAELRALATAQPEAKPEHSKTCASRSMLLSDPPKPRACDCKPEEVDDAADAALWRKHKDSFAVLQAMLEAASPLVLNKLKAQEATRQAQGGGEGGR